MSPVTPKAGLPYPTSADTADVPRDIRALADVLDPLVSSGSSIIATEESRSGDVYGQMSTPDHVPGVVVGANGFIEVEFFGMWRNSDPAGVIRAAVFIGATQLLMGKVSAAAEAQNALKGGAGLSSYSLLTSSPFGLFSDNGGTADVPSIAHGQAMAVRPAGGTALSHELGGVSRVLPIDVYVGGPLRVQVTPGTYDVSVQFRASAGSVSVKSRKLWVRSAT